MSSNLEQLIIKDVAEYYTTKFTQHGETPQGVDWNSEESQILRFEQLCKIIDKSDPFSLNDLGCGYGVLFEYISQKYQNFTYLGVDVSESMIQASKQRYQDRNNKTRFIHSSQPDQMADYSVASGIFNVRLGRSDVEWQSYLEAILDVLDHSSCRGFAFNCLTSYSDEDKMRDYLYYADPCKLFDFCKRRYSNNVALLHDYGLYEFSILVRK